MMISTKETKVTKAKAKAKKKPTNLKRKSMQIDFDNDINNNNDNDNKNEQNVEMISKKNWLTIYNNIKSMRSQHIAPVDTMGCDQCYDTDINPKQMDNQKQQRFQILVSLMLSSQTKDQVTYSIMKKLRTEHNLSIKFINEIPVDDLKELLKPAGFFRRKAEYLKKTAKILNEQYDDDIPSTLDGLMKLPGVGPKMAHLVMQVAWNKCTGIGVDTHVHRISNRLHWVRTKTPEQTRIELEKWLPKDYWEEINHLLVGFGQTICTPLRPKCNICINNKICPSSELKF